jgi:hypothetical protein
LRKSKNGRGKETKKDQERPREMAKIKKHRVIKRMCNEVIGQYGKRSRKNRGGGRGK